MKKILNIVKSWAPAIALIIIIVSTGWYVITSTSNYKAEYAKEHNCIWDYNDMCYTIDQRPWLFK